jgi:type II secretory ATPase GspE/PulE/Tfp pilus assembly ATPase PilB-like protein
VASWLGRQMEGRDQSDLAFELYKAAVEMNPADAETAGRLNGLKGKLGSNSRYDYLLRNKIVSTQQLQEALTIAKKINRSVEYALVDRFKIDIKEVGRSLSMFFGCSFRQFDPEWPIPFELIRNLKKSFLLYYVWVPLKWDKSGIEILVDDPKDLRKTDHIRALMGNQKVIFSVALKEDVEKYIQHFFDPRSERLSENAVESIDEIIPDVSFEEEVDTHEEVSLDESSSQVVKFVDQILVTAFRNGASDIHIEPSALTRKTTIRFRNDGVCYEYIQVPNAMAPAIISRLKIMAELDIAEKRLPQDGKIKVRRKGIQEFELRMSTMPTAGKYEDAVLRMSDPHRLHPARRHRAERAQPEPAEKTHRPALRHAALRGPDRLRQNHDAACGAGPHQPARGEDLDGRGPGRDHPARAAPGAGAPENRPGFRARDARFLRLDPDIIMIGEMRDKETATIGLEAALTGHLVLSTLHTNNAPETLTRMVEMGMNPLNISDAFLGVLGQRLVRRLCQGCIESYHPGEEEFEDLRMDYGREAFDAAGIAYGPGFTLKRAAGCEKCSGSGFKGRIGIHELMEATYAIKLLIKKNATSFDLARQAAAEGMTTLKQDGIRKIIDGITTIREVRRVCVD